MNLLIEPAVTEMICTPDSLITAFAKIGGLLGLSKVLGIFGVFNEWKFERKLKEKYRKRKREETKDDDNDSNKEELEEKLIEE